MAKIKFNLNRGLKNFDKSIPQSIYLRYTFGRKVNFQVSTGFKILAEDWNFENELPKNRSHVPYTELKRFINDLKAHFDKFDTENLSKGVIPNRDTVKIHYNSFFKTNEIKKDKPTLLSFIDDYIKRPRTKIDVTEGTIKTYKSFYNLLKLFNTEKYKIDFHDIDDNFYSEFIKWCESKNYSKNTIGKQIKELKKFMRRAVKEKLTDNTAFLDFIVLKEDVQNVYLNRYAVWQ